MVRPGYAAVLLAALLILCAALSTVPEAYADTHSDLQAQIDARTTQINQLESDIAALQKQLDTTSAQKQTLQSAVLTLTLSRKKLVVQITLTQAQISKVNLQIQTLSAGIATTSSNITQDSQGVEGTLRQLNEQDESPLMVALLSGGTLFSIFDEIQAFGKLRDSLENQIENLSSLKSVLQSNKAVAQEKHDELASLQSSLSQQKQSLSATIAAQKQLLAQTKNQEANYQALITQKKSQEAQFEQDLANFQSQLKSNVDVTTLPHPGSGVVSWPFSTSYMQACAARSKALGNDYCITQYFGNTPFATANPQIYNGHGHDGVDVGAPIGTPIQSVANGSVMGSGNTDLTCLGASYGKWILIKHDDGLASLYAHLSVIDVAAGQRVSRGDVIGYSGFTGYATGPHLHLTIFAADAVQISSFPSKGCPGKIYTMPVAPLDGYLNPLSYL